jgi:hypothetical protein
VVSKIRDKYKVGPGGRNSVLLNGAKNAGNVLFLTSLIAPSRAFLPLSRHPTVRSI